MGYPPQFPGNDPDQPPDHGGPPPQQPTSGQQPYPQYQQAGYWMQPGYGAPPPKKPRAGLVLGLVFGGIDTVDFWITGEVLFGTEGVPVDEGNTVDLVRENGTLLVCDDLVGG